VYYPLHRVWGLGFGGWGLEISCEIWFVNRFKIQFIIVYLNDYLIESVIENLIGILSGSLRGSGTRILTEVRKGILAGYK